LSTVMTSIIVLFASNSLGLVSQTSDFPSNLFRVVIKSGDNRMRCLSMWEIGYSWSSYNINWALSVSSQCHVGEKCDSFHLRFVF
jgi:hypothetical protein